MGLDVLNGIRVLEVAMHAADVLGLELADLGADVIKCEKPDRPDDVRTVGPVAVQSGDGLSLLHLRWNRGKRSISLDIQTDEGREAFLRLATHADVVVEGLRAGTLDGWGVGYEVLRALNPRLVFCSLSGMGGDGPYSKLPTHGTFYDAYTGMAPPERDADGEPRVPTTGGVLEYMAGGVFGALAVCAALVRAERTGLGSKIDIAQTDALAAFQAEKLDRRLNPGKTVRRSTYGEGVNFENSVRSNYYTTGDDRTFYLQAVEDKFWRAFCGSIDRQDLGERFPSAQPYDHAMNNDALRQELRAVFRQRTQREWTEHFVRAGIPGGPVYTHEELIEDPHFIARNNVAEVTYPEFGTLRLTTTPMHFSGSQFRLERAPTPGEHTQEVLHGVAGGE